MAAKPRPRNQRPSARTPHPRVRQNVPVEQVANKVAQATAPGIAFLGRMPKLLLPGFVAIGLVVGLIIGGPVGLVLLVVVTGLMAWLLAAFWPMLPTGGRMLRAGALVLVVVAGVLNL